MNIPLPNFLFSNFKGGRLIICCLLALFIQNTSFGQCQLVITQIGDPYANPGCDESFTLLNNCCDAVDISGVTVSDNAGVRHTFAAGTTLAASASITLEAREFTNDNEGGDCSETSANGYFNNSGDCAVLGNLPATHTAVNLGYNNSSDADCNPADSPFNVSISSGDDANQPTENFTPVSCLPAIAINKTAADGMDSQIVAAGDTAIFMITVTNTGAIDLINVNVADPLSPACNTTIPSIVSGESVSYLCTLPNVTASFVNEATVTGATAGGDNVMASDMSTVTLMSAPVCPTIGTLTDPADICAGETVDLSASGLEDMGMADNMEADFGINFVNFGATAPTDPYTGGASLGIVPFGDLMAGDRGVEAILTGVSLAAGTYNICAILDPLPADMTCRPSQCIELTVNETPAGPGIMGQTVFCEGEMITPITAFTSPPGPAATFNFYADAALTTTSPGTINGAEYTAALTRAGSEQVFITQTINGCESPATGVTITVNPAPEAPMVDDITVCDGEETTIAPGASDSVVLGMEDFDGGGVGFTASVQFNDGVNDHFGSTDGSNIGNISGPYSFQDGTNIFWAAEDVDDNGGDGNNPQTFTLNPVNIAGFSSVEVCIDMAAGNNNPPGSNQYDAADHVFVQYSTDVNAMLTNGFCFNYQDNGDDFNEPLFSDPNCDGDVSDGVLLTVTGQTFCFTIPDAETSGAGANTLNVVVEVAMNSGSEEIAFDNIVINGEPASMMAGNFNFYDGDPNMGGVLLAGPASEYDPMTPAGTSQSVFVTATNPFGCESEATEVVVTVNSNPLLDISTTDVTGCPGDATGTATIVASNGTGPYTFTYTTMDGSGDDGDEDGMQAMLTAGTYTVEVTDDNGCTATADFTINDAVDGDAPMIVCPASPVEVSCGESTLTANTGLATATDVCSENVLISFEDNLMLDGCGGRTGTLTRVFTATDEAGNTSTCEQVINIVDNTPPTFTAPADVTIECTDDPEDLSITGMPTDLMDNCELSPIQNLWINEFHYDDAGGDENEFFEVAGSAGLDLTGYIIELYNGNGGFTYNTIALSGIIPDEGDGFGAISFLQAGIQNGSPDGFALIDPTGFVLEFLSYEGTFTAANGFAAGLTSTDVGVSESSSGSNTASLQKVGIRDSENDFIWTGPAPQSQGLLNTNQVVTPITFPAPTFTGFTDDNLTGDPDCPNGSSFTRTFTVTDACGNTATATQVITIEDTTAPVTPAAPADLVVDCPQDIPAPLELTATDACGGDIMSTVTFEIVDRLCETRFTLIRTYTFDDGCGNSSSVSESITVTDPGDLTVEPLQDVIVDCEVNVIPRESLVEAQSSSPCGNTPTVTSVIEGPFGEAGCPGTFYNVVYTVADDCGRSAQTVQRFTIQNEGPEFVCPSQFCVIDCTDDTDQLQAKFDAYADLATVTSSCLENAEMTITNNFRQNGFIANNCGVGPVVYPGAKEYQIVTFQATDPCGRSTTCSAFVVVVDNTPPAIQGSTSVGQVECDDDVQAQYDAFIQNQINQLNATDECSHDDLTFSASPSAPNLVCENGLALTSVQITVTDDCGNATTVTTSFIIRNQDGPSVANLPSKTVECGAALNFDTPVVTDACGSTSVTFTDNTIVGNCPAVSVTTRTFTVSDACGGSTTAQQTISEIDSEAPVAPAAPANVTVSCADDIPAPVMLTATDNCAGSITVGPTPVITPGACDDQFVMVRTWTFDDGCNVSSVSQTITVNDDIAPVFTFVPTDMSDECMGSVMEFEDAVATDNCGGDVVITFVDDTNTSGICGVTITRTWTATDACGNASTASATMSTGDTQPPVASNIPMDMTIDCEETPVFGMPVFTDNCAADVTVVITNTTVNGDCDAEVMMTRTWTATDDCDNTTVISQTITTEDNDGPVFVSVPGGTFDCNGTFDEPVVTDNCSSFTVTFVDDSNGDGCNGTTIRTYTATDACGNATTATATLTINDDEPPVFTDVPGTLDVDCDEVPEFTPPTAVDNCGDVALTFVETESGELCDEGFSRKRVWTATDGCGNTATVETAIWVNKDDTPPVFTDVPGTLDVDCDEVPEFTAPTVEDDCSDVTLTFVETESGELCDEGFSRKRVWTATDGCGNTATVETAIWVNKDNTPPVFTFVPPTDQMISCADFPPTFGNVTVEDDCSGVTVTFVDDFVFGDENSCDNGESFDYRRTWTATDGCGNESTAEQKFWVMPGPAAATISGTLMTEELEMTDNVMMSLENSNAVNVSEMSTDGNFMFAVALNQNYTLTPERDDNPLNGITTYDLVLLGRHLLEIETLSSPYKLIAADINNSGNVTSLDMIALRRLILNIDETIVNNTSWRFVESNYVFPDPTNPFAATFPEVSNFNGITQSQIADFMAIKVGDLNGSAVANQLAAGDTRSSDGDLVFQLDDASLAAGEEYEVAFKARDFAAVQGYQYTLNLTGLELVEVQAGALRGITADNFGMTNLDRGVLTTSWNTQTGLTVADDEVLFTLVVKATEAVKLSEALRVSSDVTPAEGYSEQSDKLAVSLRFGEGATGTEAFTLYQNRPNPFGAETMISFNLPTAMDATLTIYDVSGRVLKQVSRNYAAGYNEELIERSDLGSTGVLYYQLETATETATKKMILVK